MRSLRSSGGVVLAAGALCLCLPISAGARAPLVNDVTQLNPIPVERIATPETVAEVQELVRNHRGAISVGGGRFSMGGQIATDGALFLDMRRMNDVVALSVEDRTITVETGITWRKIQETIDPHGLAVEIMQSYASFSVGGSLSVNVHGRYVRHGPLITSVRSLRIVLADGRLEEASPTVNPELFYGAIGGYGGLGVIVEATLDLAVNERVERASRRLPVSEYPKFFASEIRDSPTAIFHNGDLYPPRYESVMAITWSRTDRPVTVPDRLRPIAEPGLMEHVELFGVSDLPFGKQLRARILDPFLLRGNPVVWRNYEASYDVGSLEPPSRTRSTYVLQEYFVPVGHFGDFVPRMREIFRRHRVNVLNVSIRHALADPGSLLAWAREECFAFVVYYKQGIRDADRQEVGDWTRELIDAALAVGGSYYLPYQIHATEEQFRRAYPRADEYFALKRRLDPAYRFRNRLWDRYLPPYRTLPAAAPTDGSLPGAASVAGASSASTSLLDATSAAKLRARQGYLRGEEQTFLTLPEWDIVFSADEYAAFLERGGRPSQFPFFRSIGQFWGAYRAAAATTWGAYPTSWGYHAMIGVIGASFSVEYALKGLYESTLGRLTESLSTDTPEDRFIRRTAAEYAAFLHSVPWYEFPFRAKLAELWSLPREGDSSFIRSWERRISHSAELSFKSAWGWLIGKATGAAYAPEDLEITAWTRSLPADGAPLDPRVRVLEPLDATSALIALPRYEAFTGIAADLARRGVQFIEIAGNGTILVTAIAPEDWRDTGRHGTTIVEWPILTDPQRRKRVGMAVPVARLHEAIPGLEADGARIEHIFDY